MIRVAHIITDLEVAGAEMMLYKLLSGVNRSRVESHVISLMGCGEVGEKITSLGIPVHCVDMNGRKPTAGAVWKLLKSVKAFQPHIVEGWMYHGNIAAAVCRVVSTRSQPLIWNIRHSLYDMNLEKKRTARVIRLAASCSRMASKIVYNSKKSAQQHEQIGYAGERTLVIPNGFDCERFKPCPSARAALGKELGVADNDILIGLIGRYHPMKDHANFFRAAGLLAKKHPDARFILAGYDVDRRNARIVAELRSNELCDRVHLLGVRNDIPTITAALDIACSSSAYGEAFSNVVGEAMACGVPCVVTDVGDSRYIVGDTGTAVPVRDARALADACEALINAGREARLRLGSKARKRIVEKFSLDTIVRQYESLYERTLVGRGEFADSADIYDGGS